MELKPKHVIALTVFFAVTAVGLLVTSFATDHWVSSSPYRVADPSENITSADVNTGNSSFGLFNGQQSLKYQTGSRSFPLVVVCNASESVCAYIFMRSGAVGRDKLTELIAGYRGTNGSAKGHTQIEYGLFSFPIWLTTIVALSLSIVMGLVTIGFTIFNVFGRPIETITGPLGLYLWNLLSLLFTVLTLALFGALFGTQLSDNFLMFDDYGIGWHSRGQSQLDWSYFLMLGAAAAFVANSGLLFLSGQSIRCNYVRSGEKELDNGMILY